jgi:sugar diacid utilization regulator
VHPKPAPGSLPYSLEAMPTSASETPDMVDLDALDAISSAVAMGQSLPEVVRAAAKALDASLVLADRAGAVLAVAARSSADERSLMAEGREDVDLVDLRVGGQGVGTLRIRTRSPLHPVVLRLVAILLASEVERVRAPQRASQEATTAFLHATLAGELTDRANVIARGAEIGLVLDDGATVIVARAHALSPVEDGWRARVLAAAERGARAAAPGAAAALTDRETSRAEVVVVVPGVDEDHSRRTADAVLRELEAALPGHTFALGRSRVAHDPLELPRAGNEALLAANVAGGEPEIPVLAFEETGAYRLLLSAMSEDPAELQRFYAETVEPLVAYDEQYETDLVQTVEAFLDNDGNVAGTAQKLFTHRHTIRYRLERVRELSGLDVGSTDGREKLSLGLKAMRVLGVTTPAGRVSEARGAGGRVAGRKSRDQLT